MLEHFTRTRSLINYDFSGTQVEFCEKRKKSGIDSNEPLYWDCRVFEQFDRNVTSSDNINAAYSSNFKYFVLLHVLCLLKLYDIYFNSYWT